MDNSSIVLIAHGSKNPSWIGYFEDLELKLKNSFGENKIRIAYLNQSEPDLSSVIKELINKNIFHIKVLPLFMAKGEHVSNDIPKLVRELKNQFTSLKIKVLPTIGEYPEFYLMLSKIIKKELLVLNAC